MSWSRRHVLAGLGAAPTLACTRRRERRPPPIPSELEVTVPPVHRHDGPAGSRRYVVEDHGLPLVAMAVALPAGFRHEPADRPGLATLAASMLLEGVAGGGRIDLLARYGDLGARPSAYAEASLLVLDCTVQRRFAPAALALMVQTLCDSTLDPEAFERVRREQREWFEVTRGEPSMVAGLGLLAGPPGSAAPVGALGRGVARSLDAIDRDAVREFLRDHLRLDDAVFMFAGDVDPDLAERWIGDSTESWPAAARPSPPLASPAAIVPHRSDPRVVLVPWPALPQTFIALGGPRAPYGHPDEPAERIADSLISGTMHHELRTRQRAAYSVRSRSWSTRDGEAHQTWVGVDPTAADRAIAALHEQLESLRTDQRFNDAIIAESRLTAQVAAMSTFHGSERTLAQLVLMAAADLPPETATMRLQWLAEVDAEAVTEAVRRRYHRDDLRWCLTGEPSSIASARERLPVPHDATWSAADLLGLP